MGLRPLPQVCENGISADYINEYAGKVCWLQAGDVKRFWKCLNEKPIRHYEEAIFSRGLDSKMYDINLSNPVISILDQTADYVNERAADGSLDIGVFLELVVALEDVIRGIATDKDLRCRPGH